MTVINKSLLQKRTERLLTENQSTGNTLSYKDARNIGILFTQTDRKKYQAIRKMAKQFKNDGKRVEVLCYLEKGGENYDFRYDYITSKDINIWGKMQAPTAIKFAEIDFDYLYYLDLEENIYLENVLAMSKASCRIGFYKQHNQGLLDLMVQVSGKSGFETAIDQIMFYTMKLGSNGD
jgi:hypothetical protein